MRAQSRRVALAFALAGALVFFALPALAQPKPAEPPDAAPAPGAAVQIPGAAGPGEPPAAVGAPSAEVQRIHAVEVRPFTEAGRWEVSLFGPVQVNGKFTEHVGIAGEVAYHLRENLAVQVGVLWNGIAQQSGFQNELIVRANQQAFAAETILLRSAAMGGLEFMPVYGKLNIFDGKILRLGVYLNTSLGVGQTRLQLANPTSLNPATGVESDTASGRTFGDTGTRLLAALGVGFRIFLGERFTLRLELRDLVYSAYVSRVNGCTATDAAAIVTAYSSTGSAPPTPPSVSSGCDVSAFGSTNLAILGNASIAKQAILTPSADVINNLTAYAGLSYLF